MKTGGLPPGIATLLGKLGLNVGPGQQKGDGKVAKEGLQGAPKDGKGVEKGTPLADGALLAGLGHTPEDRRAALRNNVEQSNIDRFMQDPHAGLEGKELPEQFKAADAERMRDVRDQKEPREARDAQEMRETREQRDEMRRDERADETKQQAQLDQKTKDKDEERESKERDRQKDRERESEQDDEEKPGGAWLQEELERDEDEKKRRSGIREEDTLGATSRCRGHVEDGTQCLRKPMQGTPYCREHALPK